MKRLKLITTIISAILLNIGGYAQNSNSALEYSYDAAGNRTVRKVVILNKVMQTNHDSLVNNGNDTLGIATHVDNTVNNPQNTEANVNNNGEAVGSNQYAESIGEQQIVIYPNPTTGSLRVKITPFNSNAQGEIRVFDMQSHLLLREGCTKELTVVDLSKYAKGSYILKVRIGNKEREWKVVKE